MQYLKTGIEQADFSRKALRLGCNKMNSWNRSDEWEIQQTFTHQARLVVVIPGADNRASSLAALRRCVPQLRELSIPEMMRRISSSGEIDLGDIAGYGAHCLAEKLEKQGVAVKVTNTSHTDFLPINRTNGSAWLIEDPVEAKRIVEDMIAAEVPVVQVEA
jgi:hypothetical protein